MKPNKSTPPAKDSKNLKATPKGKNSPVIKSGPTRKTQTVKVVTTGTSETMRQAEPGAHSSSEVALRAYHNFQKRGSADGDHTGDWLRAESELTAERRLVRA